MAEKELTSTRTPGNDVSVKYDDALEKITRVAFDGDRSVTVEIKEGATEWSHAFAPGNGQSESVTETFAVIEDGEGNPDHDATIKVQF